MRVRTSRLDASANTEGLCGVLEETVPGYRFGAGPLLRRLARGRAVTVAIASREAAEVPVRRLVALGAVVAPLDDATLAEVRATLEAERSGQLTGDVLIDHCRELSVSLGVSAIAGDLPESVWHSLPDADLRLKDAQCSAVQWAALRSIA